MKPTNDKTALTEQIHAGRRQKLRARFLRDGLDTFNECEVLEFALGFTIPRQDTNPAAHSLLNRFGSLATVLDTNPADLSAAYGIGENAAVFLNFLRQLTSYVAKHDLPLHKVLTPHHAEDYLRRLMKTYTEETFVVMCLDHAGNVKTVNTLTNHEFDQVHINVREIVALITAAKAAQVLVAHNHLNDDPKPSVADMNLTKKLAIILDSLNIKFLDHMIFARESDTFYSCEISGLLSAFKNHYT